MNFISWNIQGLDKYLNDINLKSFLTQFDIICLCETWSRYTGEFDNFMPGFVHFDNVRKLNISSLRNSGGVSVFIRNCLVKDKLISRIFTNFNDSIVLLFKLSTISNENDLIMYFTYVSPEGSSIYHSSNEKNGINIMRSNLEQIIMDYPNASCLLAGDLNARTKDFLDYIPDDNLRYIFGDIDLNINQFDTPRATKDCNRYNTFGRSLINICCTLDLRLLNGRFQDVDGNFTCFASDGASIVDYFIISQDLFHYVTYFNVLEQDLSDHLPVSCKLQFKVNAQTDRTHNLEDSTSSNKIPKFRWFQNKSHTFMEDFKTSFLQCKTNILQCIATDINTAVHSITSLYQNAAKSMRVYNTNRHTGEQPTWWNVHCSELKQIKYRALRKFRLTNNIDDLNEYKHKKDTFKKYTKAQKQQYQKEKRNKLLIESQTNPGRFWKFIKQECRESQISNSICCNDWLTHFSTLLYDNTAEPLDIDDIVGESDAYLNSEITIDEILQSISKLGVNKSPGNDGICSEFYIHTKNEIAPILCSLFNKILSTGTFPKSWGESIICPLHKSGPKNDPNNYRGISLTTTMYKIFSIVLNSRL